MPPLDLRMGDVLRLRREHPCGNFDFEVVRLGADIGLKCIQCGRRILLPRSTLERRLDRFMRRGPTHELPPDIGPAPPPDPTSSPESTATPDQIAPE